MANLQHREPLPLDSESPKPGLPARFVFDKEKHIYTLDGRRLWSVTQVLEDNGFIDKRYFNESAASRGSAVHYAVWLDLRGRLKEDTLHPDLRGYLESWRKLYARLNPVVLQAESPSYHPVYLYAGTPDLVVRIGKTEAVWDIKTGPAAPFHRYQTSAYCLLLPEYKNGLRDRAGIHLNKDGSIANIVEHNDPSDAAYFLAFNATTQARIAHGITKEDTYGIRD